MTPLQKFSNKRLDDLFDAVLANTGSNAREIFLAIAAIGFMPFAYIVPGEAKVFAVGFLVIVFCYANIKLTIVNLFYEYLPKLNESDDNFPAQAVTIERALIDPLAPEVVETSAPPKPRGNRGRRT
jgi:hypothetical protein